MSTVVLEPGKPRRVSIRSRDPWNATGITMTAGRTYRFQASGTWIDFFIRCGADGYSSDQAPFFSRSQLKKHEPRRRMPREKWFALIGAIDRDRSSAFKIGTEMTLTIERTGELTCFANDEPAFYWNNWGSVELTVTLVPE